MTRHPQYLRKTRRSQPDSGSSQSTIARHSDLYLIARQTGGKVGGLSDSGPLFLCSRAPPIPARD
jgi:hypothetical protein